MLLADLAMFFKSSASDRLASQAIVDHLAALEDRPWPEYKNGEAITKNQLARLLARYEISSSTIRLSDGTTPKGYYRAAFDDAFARSLPAAKRHSATSPAEISVFRPIRNATSGRLWRFAKGQECQQ